MLIENLKVVKSEKRSRSAPEISALWRERLGPLPGMKQLRFLDVAAGGQPIAIDLEISGLAIDQMTAAAEEMKEKLRNFSGLFDISDTHAGGKRELKLKLKPGSAEVNACSTFFKNTSPTSPVFQ